MSLRCLGLGREDAFGQAYDDLDLPDQIKSGSQNGYNNVPETKGNHAGEVAGNESKNNKKVPMLQTMRFSTKAAPRRLR